MGIFQPAFRSETSRKKQKTCLKDCEEPFKILKSSKKHQNCKKMKMTTDLEQWLIKPNSTSKQLVSDPLAAFRKMSLSISEPKFCLPSILTSGNNSTWLATRKNDNEMAKSANFSAKSANVQIPCQEVLLCHQSFRANVAKISGFPNLLLPNKLKVWLKIWKDGYLYLRPIQALMQKVALMAAAEIRTQVS